MPSHIAQYLLKAGWRKSYAESEISDGPQKGLKYVLIEANVSKVNTDRFNRCVLKR
jgi:hypothetical protein